MTENEKALLVGGGALLLLSMSGGKSKPSTPSTPSTPSVPTLPRDPRPPLADRIRAAGRWFWPLPTIQVAGTPGYTYVPTVSDGFHESRADHDGVDIMYKRQLPTDTKWKVGQKRPWDIEKYPTPPQGTKWFFCPLGTQVRAFAAGYVWTAAETARGWNVLIDHGTYTSYYQHLRRLTIPGLPTSDAPIKLGKNVATGAKVPIVANGVIGEAGQDPSQGASSPVHLHFELADYLTNSAGQNVRIVHDPAPILQAAERWIASVAA